MGQSEKVSPLAPESVPNLEPLRGVMLGSVASGIKYKDRDDLLLMVFEPGTRVAGVFTKSSTAAAPVVWCKDKVKHGAARALLVNSGNANAFTGDQGMQDIQTCVKATAEALDCNPDEVLMSSTGVIGEPLPTDKIAQAMPDLVNHLSSEGWGHAADAIRTTDTFVKLSTRKVLVGDEQVTIHGIAKGSGMIEPNMATMLAYIVTDAVITAPALQEILSETNQVSFNSITVDSDTSTNDTVLAFATNQAGNAAITCLEDPISTAFVTGFQEVMVELAQMIVRDGEGASKFVQIVVKGAKSDKDAQTIAKSIANSPLVKTAIAGEDANWGRVIMAVGKSGVSVPSNDIDVRIGGVQITHNGAVVDGYNEAPVAEHMKGQEINIQVNVGKGSGNAKVWTSDLTAQYIAINADYRS
ncbi:MAG: bifunctional glutamate N-acetyltransferase/amino-acid acetyltransferase ArgJ [Rickettsiales bacterium]|nr:bifunctional glutamate N-acetyltransferase/amino-acid acetyltransferase ArgJ [Rickettsiales bacterium]